MLAQTPAYYTLMYIVSQGKAGRVSIIQLEPLRRAINRPLRTKIVCSRRFIALSLLIQEETAGDRKLAALVAETANRQAALEARFPEAFESVESAVEERQAIRKSLNDSPEFQARNRAVVDAGKAIKDYELQADPGIANLAAKSKAYIESLKSSEATKPD